MLCVENLPQAVLALVFLSLEGGSLVVTHRGAQSGRSTEVIGEFMVKYLGSSHVMVQPVGSMIYNDCDVSKFVQVL